MSDQPAILPEAVVVNEKTESREDNHRYFVIFWTFYFAAVAVSILIATAVFTDWL